MDGWSIEQRHVSRAFDDWRFVDADIRAFLNLTVQWVRSGHNEAWVDAEAVAAAVFDPDQNDIGLSADLYIEKVRLWRADHMDGRRRGPERRRDRVRRGPGEKALRKSSPHAALCIDRAGLPNLSSLAASRDRLGRGKAVDSTRSHPVSPTHA